MKTEFALNGFVVSCWISNTATSKQKLKRGDLKIYVYVTVGTSFKEAGSQRTRG